MCVCVYLKPIMSNTKYITLLNAFSLTLLVEVRKGEFEIEVSIWIKLTPA